VLFIARKAKVAEETDNFDESHTYKCLRCGAEHQNPIGHFYKIQYSELYLKNDRYVPLCKNCINEIYENLSSKYGAKTAFVILCYMIDIPFYHSLFDSIVKNNNLFSVGLYLRQINGRQYQYQSFQQTILNKELEKSDKQVLDEKEVKWTKSEIQNKDDVIKTVGYDPFEGYPEEDRRFLFNELIKYFDDDIADDTYKLSQVIQIVNNNNQIRNYDILISRLDAIKDANDIKSLNTMKSNLVSSNDKIAKENEISVKNRSNKDVGKSTLTYLMKDLREKDFEKAEANYYNQLNSDGTLWAENMSMKAIKENGFFDENDNKEITEINRQLVLDLQHKVDDLMEEKRLLLIQVQELENGGHNE
jgi:hypothetical protein